MKYGLFSLVIFQVLSLAPALGADELRFDLGNAKSPKADGWQRLTPAMLYESSRGYGWEQPPEDAFSRTQHWPVLPSFVAAYKDGLPDTHKHLRGLKVDPLTQDGVQSASPMILRVDLPNGKYVVRAWLGDYVEAAPLQNVVANGQPIVQKMDSGIGGLWGQILRLAVRPVRGVVEVQNGSLRLTFSTSSHSQKARVTAIQIRRFVPSPVQLQGKKLVWTGPADKNAQLACQRLNKGNLKGAHQLIDAMTAASSQYPRACLLEALAGSMQSAATAESTRPVEEALKILQDPLPGVDPMAVAERRQLLQDYRQAHQNVALLSYERSYRQTHKGRYRRFREAIAMAQQVQPNEPLYWQAQLLKMRVHFWLGREGIKKEADLARPEIAQLFQEFPDVRLVRIYADQPVPALKKSFLENSTAPEWAVVERALLASVLDVARFWIAERQIETGEIGGGFNDDVEALRSWGRVAMAVDIPWLNEGIARLADGAWHTHPDLSKHGYPGGIGDVEHSAEDIADTQPLAMALHYGEPRFVANCLLSISNMPRTWTALSGHGRRYFRSYNYGYDQVDSDPRAGFDVPLNARATKAGLWALWYTNNPSLRRIFQEWGEAWVHAAMRIDEGKPAGVFPAGIRVTDESFPNPWYATPQYTQTGEYDDVMYEQLLGMWLITGEKKFLQPMHASLQRIIEQQGSSVNAAWPVNNVRRELLPALSKWRFISGDRRYDDYLAQHGPVQVRYLLGAIKEKAFIESLRNSVQSNTSHIEMLTSECLFTDRIFLAGVSELYTLYGGGIGDLSGCPGHAVRWENTGEDLAAWVEEASQSRFRARLYNFAHDDKKFGMQHWRLAPGRYLLELHRRSSKADSLIKKVVEISHRGDTIFFDVPPEEELLVELTQQEAYAWNPAQLPDLATTRKPTSQEGETVVWPVYNLGSAPAREVHVQLLEDGRVVEIATISEISPVANYQLGVANVQFQHIRTEAALSLQVDPEDRIDEITERNNRSDR